MMIRYRYFPLTVNASSFMGLRVAQLFLLDFSWRCSVSLALLRQRHVMRGMVWLPPRASSVNVCCRSWVSCGLFFFAYLNVLPALSTIVQLPLGSAFRVLVVRMLVSLPQVDRTRLCRTLVEPRTFWLIVGNSVHSIIFHFS